jgi:hypothetical protein
MSVFERFKGVVKAELGHLRRRAPQSAVADGAQDGPRPATPAKVPRRSRAVVDVEGALRVLELSGTPALADVRARYRALARNYHPKTQSAIADEADAARVVVDALTDALELLEEHHLPV